MLKLDRLVNVLGGYGARLLTAPVSRQVELRSVVVHDPADPRPASGDVFLPVGVESADEAVRLARAARAAVVLVREGAPIGESARDGGIAVLLVDPEVSWSQLYGRPRRGGGRPTCSPSPTRSPGSSPRR
jgi:hypothetical protein